MQILLGYFLFSVLLRTGTTFQCIQCQDNAPTCTGTLKTCNQGEASCLKSVSEDVQGEKTETKVDMGCAPSSICKTEFIELSYGKGVYVRKQYDCCKNDGCTPPSTKMSPVNTTANGNRCPVCSLETGSCSEDAPLECTGSAMHCVEFSILKDGAKRHVKGCTTEAVCNILKTYTNPLIGNSPIQSPKDVTCQRARNNSVSVASGGRYSSLGIFLLALLPMNLFLFSAY